MHPRTLATLEELRNADWFSKVGEHDTDGLAVVVSSWKEAEEQCASYEWQTLCQEAVNQYRERIREKSLDAYRTWNDVVLKVKPAVYELTAEKIRNVIEEQGLGAAFVNSVNWDILHVCIEAELADVYPPGFFAARAYWYVNGHFPCGWEGDFPAGSPIVY